MNSLYRNLSGISAHGWYSYEESIIVDKIFKLLENTK